MPRRNVIAQSGQTWKLVLSFAAVLIGGTCSIVGMVFLGAHPGHPLNTFGLVAGFAGLLFAWLFIRCPGCGARWVWLAMRHHAPGEWHVWLQALPTCPSCPSGDAKTS